MRAMSVLRARVLMYVIYGTYLLSHVPNGCITTTRSLRICWCLSLYFTIVLRGL